MDALESIGRALGQVVRRFVNDRTPERVVVVPTLASGATQTVQLTTLLPTGAYLFQSAGVEVRVLDPDPSSDTHNLWVPGEAVIDYGLGTGGSLTLINRYGSTLSLTVVVTVYRDLTGG